MLFTTKQQIIFKNQFIARKFNDLSVGLSSLVNWGCNFADSCYKLEIILVRGIYGEKVLIAR